ncbi:hypothetical protein CR513_46351, partial [Mucuna pruriens]
MENCNKIVTPIEENVKLIKEEVEKPVIEDLKSASGMEMQGGKSKLGTDSKTLLRILWHTSDSEASQFLKKQYKISSSSS